jgi:hypothetical protein
MDPFDEGYFARREKQIQDLYMMRALVVALGGVGLAGLLIVFFMRESSWAPIAFLFSLVFLLAAFLLLVVSTAERAAERTIQREHERLIALYGQSGVKPKRDEAATPVQLADDGEIDADILPDEQSRAGRRHGA